MSLLSPSESRLVCRTQLTGEGRWIRLSLALGESAANTRLLVNTDQLACEITGLDELSRTYSLPNWTGSVISGARYGFRLATTAPRQVWLHELQGRLESDDVWAIASATALAVTRLLAETKSDQPTPPSLPIELHGWKLEQSLWTSPPDSADALPIAHAHRHSESDPPAANS